jgi:hypothetical protein
MAMFLVLTEENYGGAAYVFQTRSEAEVYQATLAQKTEVNRYGLDVIIKEVCLQQSQEDLILQAPSFSK